MPPIARAIIGNFTCWQTMPFPGRWTNPGADQSVCWPRNYNWWAFPSPEAAEMRRTKRRQKLTQRKSRLPLPTRRPSRTKIRPQKGKAAKAGAKGKAAKPGAGAKTSADGAELPRYAQKGHRHPAPPHPLPRRRGACGKSGDLPGQAWRHTRSRGSVAPTLRARCAAEWRDCPDLEGFHARSKLLPGLVARAAVIRRYFDEAPGASGDVKKKFGFAPSMVCGTGRSIVRRAPSRLRARESA